MKIFNDRIVNLRAFSTVKQFFRRYEVLSTNYTSERSRSILSLSELSTLLLASRVASVVILANEVIYR